MWTPTHRRAIGALTAALFVFGTGCSGGGSPSSEEVRALPSAGAWLEVGKPVRFDQDAHCGFRVLSGKLNGQIWRADGHSEADWFPSGWTPANSTPDGPVAVQLVLSEDAATIVASLNGTEVTYIASGDDFIASDLCE